MEIKFCKNGDGRIAIGTGKRPVEFCRECYQSDQYGEFQQWKVLNPFRGLGEEAPVVDAKTGEDIYEGGTVWLDPVETSIPALIYSGFIEALPPAAPVKAPKGD